MRPRVNLQITTGEMRVVTEEGTDLGILTRNAALELVRTKGEDLVEIDPEATPPLCMVIDYGKYQYQLQERHKDRAHD